VRVGKRDRDSVQGGVRVIPFFSRHSSFIFYSFVFFFSSFGRPPCTLISPSFLLHLLTEVVEGHFYLSSDLRSFLVLFIGGGRDGWL